MPEPLARQLVEEGADRRLAFELTAIEGFELDRDARIRRRWGAPDSASQNRQIGLE